MFSLEGEHCSKQGSNDRLMAAVELFREKTGNLKPGYIQINLRPATGSLTAFSPSSPAPPEDLQPHSRSPECVRADRELGSRAGELSQQHPPNGKQMPGLPKTSLTRAPPGRPVPARRFPSGRLAAGLSYSLMLETGRF